MARSGACELDHGRIVAQPRSACKQISPRWGRVSLGRLPAQAGELPEYRIEEARANTAMAYREMQQAARHLLIRMPTDPKGLVDLSMYLEKNFSVLPQEVIHGGSGQSLAGDLLRTCGCPFGRSPNMATRGRHHETPAPIGQEAQPATSLTRGG